MIREYVLNPYYSRFETMGVSVAVAVFTREFTLHNTAVALATLVGVALVAASVKTSWRHK